MEFIFYKGFTFTANLVEGQIACTAPEGNIWYNRQPRLTPCHGATTQNALMHLSPKARQEHTCLQDLKGIPDPKGQDAECKSQDGDVTPRAKG